jgi:hypothetical protein
LRRCESEAIVQSAQIAAKRSQSLRRHGFPGFHGHHQTDTPRQFGIQADRLDVGYSIRPRAGSDGRARLSERRCAVHAKEADGEQEQEYVGQPGIPLHMTLLDPAGELSDRFAASYADLRKRPRSCQQRRTLPQQRLVEVLADDRAGDLDRACRIQGAQHAAIRSGPAHKIMSLKSRCSVCWTSTRKYDLAARR